jgi:hypothetical protein
MAPPKQLLTPGSPSAHPGSGASRARSGRPHPRPGELDADFTFLGIVNVNLRGIPSSVILDRNALLFIRSGGWHTSPRFSYDLQRYQRRRLEPDGNIAVCSNVDNGLL